MIKKAFGLFSKFYLKEKKVDKKILSFIVKTS